jgi:hypothetical protein
MDLKKTVLGCLMDSCDSGHNNEYLLSIQGGDFLHQLFKKVNAPWGWFAN